MKKSGAVTENRRRIALLKPLTMGFCAVLLVFSLAGCGSRHYEFSQSKNGITVEMAITPYPQQSLVPNTYDLKITRNGQALNTPVKMDFKMTNMDMGNNLVQATAKGKGTYEVRKMLSMSGKWQIFVETQGQKFVFDTTAAGQKVKNAKE
ncbi:FixH family protein [Acididesulfobacillus acetoxydans]|nr:FixH family protein [Acididesulfobacillus acetoxydans]